MTAAIDIKAKKAVSVKCPSCGEQFPLNEAVLGSERERISRELEAGLNQRERELAIFRAPRTGLRGGHDAERDVRRLVVAGIGV